MDPFRADPSPHAQVKRLINSAMNHNINVSPLLRPGYGCMSRLSIRPATCWYTPSICSHSAAAFMCICQGEGFLHASVIKFFPHLSSSVITGGLGKKWRNKRWLNVLLIAVATVAQQLQEVTKGAGIQMRENETMSFPRHPTPSRTKEDAANTDFFEKRLKNARTWVKYAIDSSEMSGENIFMIGSNPETDKCGIANTDTWLLGCAINCWGSLCHNQSEINSNLEQKCCSAVFLEHLFAEVPMTLVVVVVLGGINS